MLNDAYQHRNDLHHNAPHAPYNQLSLQEEYKFNYHTKFENVIPFPDLYKQISFTASLDCFPVLSVNIQHFTKLDNAYTNVKLFQLNEFIKQFPVAIIALQEVNRHYHFHHLICELIDYFNEIEGDNLYDPACKTLYYVHKDLRAFIDVIKVPVDQFDNWKLRKATKTDRHWSTWLIIHPNDHFHVAESTIIGNVYSSPNSHSPIHDLIITYDIIAFIKNNHYAIQPFADHIINEPIDVNNSLHSIILVGDFNFKHVRYSSQYTTIYDDLDSTYMDNILYQYHLDIANHFGTPTHVKGNVLDYVIYSPTTFYTDPECYIVDLGISDHFGIYTLFKYRKLTTINSTLHHEQKKYAEFKLD